MNKKIYYFILYSFIILLMIILFNNIDVLVSSVSSSLYLFITKVFPYLFVMMILNNLLINLNFPYYIAKAFKNPSWYIFIMSALSGSPINAYILSNFLDKNYLTEKDASVILSFTTLNNPLFLYAYFTNIFNNQVIIVKLFILIYTSNILIYFIYKNKLKKSNYIINYENTNLFESITKAINNSINNLIKICAIIVFFKLISDLLIYSNNYFSIIFKGILELTTGLESVRISTLSVKLKEIITYSIISFSGFSIQIQLSSILSKYNINYKYFYISKIIQIIFGIFIILHT